MNGIREMADVQAELDTLIPRGRRRSVENRARQILWALRMNSVGSHREVAPDPLLLRDLAFETARREAPPELAHTWERPHPDARPKA